MLVYPFTFAITYSLRYMCCHNVEITSESREKVEGVGKMVEIS